MDEKNVERMWWKASASTSCTAIGKLYTRFWWMAKTNLCKVAIKKKRFSFCLHGKKTPKINLIKSKVCCLLILDKSAFG
jgi:hypothetical protein